MKRLLAACAAVLALPSVAAAKELQSLALCGQDGTCHVLRDHASLVGYERGLLEATPPEAAGPFLRLRVTIGGDEMPRPVVESGAWLPAARLVRTQDDRGAVFWAETGRRATAVLRRAARGLELFPAAKLGPLGSKPGEVRVDEVVLPPGAGADGGSGGGGDGSGWAWSLLAIAPAGLAFWLLRRRRGRPRLA